MQGPIGAAYHGWRNGQVNRINFDVITFKSPSASTQTDLRPSGQLSGGISQVEWVKQTILLFHILVVTIG